MLKWVYGRNFVYAAASYIAALAIFVEGEGRQIGSAAKHKYVGRENSYVVPCMTVNIIFSRFEIILLPAISKWRRRSNVTFMAVGCNSVE